MKNWDSTLLADKKPAEIAHLFLERVGENYWDFSKHCFIELLSYFSSDDLDQIYEKLSPTNSFSHHTLQLDRSMVMVLQTFSRENSIALLKDWIAHHTQREEKKLFDNSERSISSFTKDFLSTIQVTEDEDKWKAIFDELKPVLPEALHTQCALFSGVDTARPEQVKTMQLFLQVICNVEALGRELLLEKSINTFTSCDLLSLPYLTDGYRNDIYLRLLKEEDVKDRKMLLDIYNTLSIDHAEHNAVRKKLVNLIAINAFLDFEEIWRRCRPENHCDLLEEPDLLRACLKSFIDYVC